MRLIRGQDVAGVEPMTARSVVRGIGPRGGFAAKVERVGIPEAEAAIHLGKLEKGGFVSSHLRSNGRPFYEMTTAGSALNMASFLKPMPRAKAALMLRDVIDRAERYNADASRLLLIDEIIIFGSYIKPEAEEMGDLDLIIKHSRKASDDQYIKLAVRQAEDEGPQNAGHLDRLFYPLNQMKKALKNRSGYISIVDNEPGDFEDGWKICYRREPHLIDTTIESPAEITGNRGEVL